MLHTPILDPVGSTVQGFLPSVDPEQPHSPHTIELDCAPGGTRPWDLILGVIEGTGLTTDQVGDNHPYSFFGHTEWAFPETTCDQWVEIQKIIVPRIKALYHRGAIRYGTW